MTPAPNIDGLARYAIHPENGHVFPLERGAWVRYVDAAAAIEALRAERDTAREAIVNWYACHEIDTQADDETITESERALEAIARAALAAKEAPNAE